MRIMKQIRFTKEGLEKLKQKRETLLNQRPAAVEDLKKSRELGDLSENGYYKSSRARLSFIDGQLFRLKRQIQYAIVVEEQKSTTVTIGSIVTLSNKKTYMIVGDLEANPSEGKISLLSPLGRALHKKILGEKIYLTTPKGNVTYCITALR
jgi:transcription elongation factor GreA